MKKVLVIAAVAALGLSACSKHKAADTTVTNTSNTVELNAASPVAGADTTTSSKSATPTAGVETTKTSTKTTNTNKM